MPAPEPVKVDLARGDVIDALVRLRPDAFAQALTWLMPKRDRPIRFGAMHGTDVDRLRMAIDRYFDALAAAAAAAPAAAR